MTADLSLDIAALAEQVCAGNRRALARALNLLDDARESAREQAARFLETLAGRSAAASAHLVGMTGPPGVGKSSLGAALIREWRRRGLRVGVLAVDPSSPVTGGALLGDRLRMQASTEDDGVFVRSLSNRGEFGGLSAEVWPMSVVMLACFDVVLIETVGVGQREVDIARMCDTTCFVAQPGSGDTIQFLKAGILEVPHILVVNKADMGDVANRTRRELASSLGREHADGGWEIPVIATSATRNEGVAQLVDTIEQHRQALLGRQSLTSRRSSYQAYWLLKRLGGEFGSYGIDTLGGYDALARELQDEALNPFTQYAALRARLLKQFNNEL